MEVLLFENIRNWGVELFLRMGIQENISIILQSILALLFIIIFAIIADKFTTYLLKSFLPKIVNRTKTKFDDILLEQKVFSQLSHFILGLVILVLIPLIAWNAMCTIVLKIVQVYFVIISINLCNAIFKTIEQTYKQIAKKDESSLRLMLQFARVAIISLGVIIIISIFANKNFLDILTGLGAMITVIMIVYKDTILGFVAGIQLSAYNMLKIGDWIELHNGTINGTVLDISLNTVKVQNWDMTISTIPTYKLVSEPFKNWKGMQESHGRRIKRSILIDINTIHFLTEEEVEKLSRFDLLKDYLKEKKGALLKSNNTITDAVNERRLTNVGTFRQYIENYLIKTDLVNLDYTYFVHQLQATEKGLPLEIYLFCKIKEWKKYEMIQSDFFDHIIAIAPEFGLKVYQYPSSLNC